MLTKTKQPELHRYWTTRDRAAVEAGVFPPRVAWHCEDCSVRSQCWAWG